MIVRRVVETALPLWVQEVSWSDEGEASSSSSASADDRPTFVLLHGYAANSFTWRHWTPELAGRGRVLLVDLKGFGRAPKPDDGAYGPSDLAAPVADLVRKLDLRRLTLVGHSLGGGVALLTALRLLDEGRFRLERLVLVSSAAYPQRLPPFVHFARRPWATSLLVRIVGARRTVRWALRAIVFDPTSVTEGMVAAYGDPLATPDGLRATLDVGRAIVPTNLAQLNARYPEIDVPTLLLWGDHDRVVPLSVARRLAEELPRARLAVLERCGHTPPEEQPETSLRAVSRFLDEG